MASLERSEVYIPQDACVRTVRLQDLPLAISRRLGVCGRASEPASSPTATWICPVELRAGAGEAPEAGGAPHRTLLPLQGQVWLPVVSASLLTHQLLQEALSSADLSRSPAGLGRGAAPVSRGKVSVGRKNAIILYEGQIFLLLRKTKNQQGGGVCTTIQHNGGAGGTNSGGRSEQEPAREASSPASACCVAGVQRDEVSVRTQQHMEVAENSVLRDGIARSLKAELLSGACSGSSGSSSGRQADVNADPEPQGRGGSQATMAGAKRSWAADSESSVKVSRGDGESSQGAESTGVVQTGEEGGHPALCSRPSAHQDTSGCRSVGGASQELHRRVKVGRPAQARAPPPSPGPQEHGWVGGAEHDHPEEAFPTDLSPAAPADISVFSVFEELEQMEKISHLRAILRIKEAELKQLNTLKGGNIDDSHF